MVVKMLFVGSKSIRSGGDLTGTLQIVATRPIPAECLEVSFEGEEYVSVPAKETGIRGRLSHSWQETQKTVDLSIAAERVNRMIQREKVFPAGSCEVQFAIPLPCSLPTSTIVSTGNGCAKVEYRLKAILRGSEDYEDYETSQLIQVYEEQHTIQARPRTVKPRCHHVKGLFFSQGQIFTAAQAKNTVLLPGEQLEFDLAVANESKNTIHNIQVVLRERVRWSALGHSKTVMTNLVSVCLNANTAPSRRRSGTNLLMERLQDRHQEERNLQLVEDRLIKGDNCLSFTLPPVPEQARMTYVGSRLSVTHEVIITLDSKKWKRNPEVRIPVRIVRNDTSLAGTVDTSSSSKALLASPANDIVVTNDDPGCSKATIVDPCKAEPLPLPSPVNEVAHQRSTSAVGYPLTARLRAH